MPQNCTNKSGAIYYKQIAYRKLMFRERTRAQLVMFFKSV